MTEPARATEPIVSAAELESTVQAEHPWLQLKPERFHVLRLAALPADRETGLRALRFVSLGRVERHSKEESFLRLSISLPGQTTHKEINTFDLWADHKEKLVRINPDLPLRTDPGNRGLGRFILAQAVIWAQRHWGHYKVVELALLVKHSTDEAARLRRDHALQAQGFTVSYDDAVKMSATCSAGRVSELHSDWNEKKVSLISSLDTAAMLEKADQALNEQNRQIKVLDDHIDLLKREDSTLRFSITMLTIFAVFQAALLIWIATR